MRELLAELRDSGVQTGGPPPLSNRDRESFANRLDIFLRGTRRKMNGRVTDVACATSRATALNCKSKLLQFMKNKTADVADVSAWPRPDKTERFVGFFNAGNYPASS